jgi:DNA-binding helix-hairpin-helix protein with protein kinase domain
LAPEIHNRQEIKRPFNEQELLYLFYSLVKIEAMLEGQGRWIGDVKPENILVNEDGYVKILSQYSYPAEPNRIVGWSKEDR